MGSPIIAQSIPYCVSDVKVRGCFPSQRSFLCVFLIADMAITEIDTSDGDRSGIVDEYDQEACGAIEFAPFRSGIYVFFCIG